MSRLKRLKGDCSQKCGLCHLLSGKKCSVHLKQCEELDESIGDSETLTCGSQEDSHTERNFNEILAWERLDLKSFCAEVKWRSILAPYLRLDYAVLLPKYVAEQVFMTLEQQVEYFSGRLAQVKVFGKWHDVPRKQATYGDAGLTYTFSGVTTPAREWLPVLLALKKLVNNITGHQYNFVLINRYKDGHDKIGEHKDDEKELDPNVPIASLSLGQERLFYLRHEDDKRGLMNIEKGITHCLLELVLVESESISLSEELWVSDEQIEAETNPCDSPPDLTYH